MTDRYPATPCHGSHVPIGFRDAYASRKPNPGETKMTNFNSVVLVGRLTQDPELRYAPSGTPLCSFTVTTSRRMTDETGAKVDYTTSVDVEVERRLAEVCAQFLRKGREVLVMGTLCQSHWIDPKTRKPRSKIKVVSQQIQFLGPPPAPEDSSPEELVDASDE